MHDKAAFRMQRPVLPWRVAKHLPGAMRRPLDRLLGVHCSVCGQKAIRARVRSLSPELIASWQLPTSWVQHFERREGMRCTACGANARAQHMAGVITMEVGKQIGLPISSLAALVIDSHFHTLEVAEINACGALHQFLISHPRLCYSEFGGICPTRSEDIQALTYAAESFDMVLTSDTLEHVPDIMLALSEVRRVLKHGGLHVFTIPVLTGRRTRIRAVVERGVVRHLLPPSYHGAPGLNSEDRLVFIEAGDDFETLASAAGFPLRSRRDPNNPAIVTFLYKRE